MWQDLGGLSGVGVNSGAHQVEFGTAELTPEQQKILIDIRRKKTELLLEIQENRLLCGTVRPDFHVGASAMSPHRNVSGKRALHGDRRIFVHTRDECESRPWRGASVAPSAAAGTRQNEQREPQLRAIA
ncbi:uncharacterized protein LOC116847028 isoform X1 [Odontomachus brunneus]|uniref:uncharacterized protein LOC116847028 isoform X1 n=1 Tax=Odontomachus brunneus TaxID=486640 RepID=UPI0013F1E32B|nr:uncharacterized protein LOC116847028 isoform X1 [Odontomachus brunneus]